MQALSPVLRWCKAVNQELEGSGGYVVTFFVKVAVHLTLSEAFVLTAPYPDPNPNPDKREDATP